MVLRISMKNLRYKKHLIGLKSRVRKQIRIAEYHLNTMVTFGECVQEITELIFCWINNSSNILKIKVSKKLFVINVEKNTHLILVKT